ncbi:MAG: hypothetical protein K9L56_14505 [Clostridiales bacterium]|nr:hypothetical protein [Clostridiales bacterium]
MRDIRTLFYHGTGAQLEKLCIHHGKKGFEQATPDYCIKRIHEELIELEEARTVEEMRHEAADIANFCHMLIMHCDKKMGNTVQNDKKCGNI